jgi:hypothetical protein
LPDGNGNLRNSDEFPIRPPTVPARAAARRAGRAAMPRLAAPRRAGRVVKLRGRLEEVSRNGVRGWAIDMARPELPLELLIRADGTVVDRCLANKPKPALRETLGQGVSGNHAFAHTFAAPLPSFRAIDIDVVEAASGQAIPNGARQLRGLETAAVPLRPILVTSTGRSGTTLLMSELLRHPRIVVADRYPYEIKLLSYYAAALKVLTAEMDRTNSTTPDNLFDRIGRYRVGHNPFNSPGFYSIVANRAGMARLFEERIPLVYARGFREVIEEYYDLVRIDQDKREAMYFAEKVDLNEAARSGPRVLFGTVKEIAMLRDPRDLLCSAKAFWKLESGAALDMIRSTVPRVQAVAQSGSAEILALRYEDLVAEPRAAKARLYRFLGLRDDDQDDTLGDTTIFARHATSQSADASIGRWRQDLTAEEARAVTAAFGDYMEAFGYPP